MCPIFGSHIVIKRPESWILVFMSVVSNEDQSEPTYVMSLQRPGRDDYSHRREKWRIQNQTILLVIFNTY